MAACRAFRWALATSKSFDRAIAPSSIVLPHPTIVLPLRLEQDRRHLRQLQSLVSAGQVSDGEEGEGEEGEGEEEQVTLGFSLSVVLVSNVP
jgi:hypothetical protein